MSGIPTTRRAAMLATALVIPAAQDVAAQADPAPMSTLVARAIAGTVGVLSGGVGGTKIRLAAGLAAVFDNGDQLRVLPIVGRGSVLNSRTSCLFEGLLSASCSLTRSLSRSGRDGLQVPAS